MFELVLGEVRVGERPGLMLVELIYRICSIRRRTANSSLPPRPVKRLVATLD